MFKAEGKYSATVIEAGLGADKDGVAQPFMKFKATNGSETAEFYWTGSLKSEKSTELAIKALLTAGFGGDDIDDLKRGLMIFMPKDIVIELEEQTDKDGNGTGKLKVKWVNAARKEFTGAAPKLAGAFAKVRQQLGIKKQQNTDWP